MSQSVSLPSGMLESLGKYKEALKETKREMRELEREARRMQKGGGTVSREVAGRLEAARGSRARLEDAIVQQKAKRRSGIGTAAAYTAGGFIGASAALTDAQFTQKVTSTLKRIASVSGPRVGTAAVDVTVMGLKGAFRASEYFKPHTTAAKAWRAARLNEMRKLGSRMRPDIHKINTAGREAFDKSIGSEVGFLKSTGKRLAGLVSIGVTIGSAINDIRAGRIGIDRARAESTIGTEKMYSDILGSVGFGGTAARNFTDIKKSTQGVGKSHADALVYSGIYTYLKTKLYGGNKEAIALEDRVTAASVRRTMMGIQYGNRFSGQMDADWIKDKLGGKYREKMWEKMGWQNKIFNSIANHSWWTDEKDVAFSDYYIFSDSKTHTENQVLEEIRTEREGKWQKEQDDKIKLFNNTFDVTRAIQRADAHERTNAITAFNNDRLTRGLTWSQ